MYLCDLFNKSCLDWQFNSVTSYAIIYSILLLMIFISSHLQQNFWLCQFRHLMLNVRVLSNHSHDEYWVTLHLRAFFERLQEDTVKLKVGSLWYYFLFVRYSCIFALVFCCDHLLSYQSYEEYQMRIRNCCHIQGGAVCDNIWKPLTIITKSSTLDVAAVLDPPLSIFLSLIRKQ